MNILTDYAQFLPPPLRDLPWRAHPLDGALLLFERDTGLNVLLEGDETAHLTRLAPRNLLIAVTNACNLTCGFCYRDLESRSLWRYDTLMQFCRDADDWGVLEVSFGGGEPTLFPQWADFIRELHATTRLCINFTTNGTLLTDEFLRDVAGCYGQIRVSLYDDVTPHPPTPSPTQAGRGGDRVNSAAGRRGDGTNSAVGRWGEKATFAGNDWQTTVARLADCGARFGVNWLITPAELPTLDAKFARLLALGARDFLLLGYKGGDASMHLRGADLKRLSDFVNRAYQQLGGAVSLKLDSCWGNALPNVPRLFETHDCGAGGEFLSITSDRRVKVCSFQATETGIPFETLADVRRIWEARRAVKQAALIGGCARLPNRGLSEEGVSHAVIRLAAVQQQS